MSKLSDYLEKEKIDPRRVLYASKSVEALKQEDRAILAARRQAKDGGSDEVKELAAKPCRSGKPLSGPTLARALRGDKLKRGARQRVVRALNSVLTKKKKPEVSASDLF